MLPLLCYMVQRHIVGCGGPLLVSLGSNGQCSLLDQTSFTVYQPCVASQVAYHKCNALADDGNCRKAGLCFGGMSSLMIGCKGCQEWW